MTYILIVDNSRYIFQGLVIILEYWELIDIPYPFSLCYIFRGLWSTSGTYMYLPGWLGQRNWASRSPKSLLTSSHQSFKLILNAMKRPQSHTAHCYQGWTPRPAGKGGFPAPPRPIKMIKTAEKLRGKINTRISTFSKRGKKWWNNITTLNNAQSSLSIGYARESKKWKYFVLFLLTGHQTLFSKICQRMK